MLRNAFWCRFSVHHLQANLRPRCQSLTLAQAQRYSCILFHIQLTQVVARVLFPPQLSLSETRVSVFAGVKNKGSPGRSQTSRILNHEAHIRFLLAEYIQDIVVAVEPIALSALHFTRTNFLG